MISYFEGKSRLRVTLIPLFLPLCLIRLQVQFINPVRLVFSLVSPSPGPSGPSHHSHLASYKGLFMAPLLALCGPFSAEQPEWSFSSLKSVLVTLCLKPFSGFQIGEWLLESM